MYNFHVLMSASTTSLSTYLLCIGHESPSINRPGIYLPEYKWWNEGLHGMAWTDCCPPDSQWDNVTVFPQVIGLAMTFNRTLWSEIGGVIGTEAIQKTHTSPHSAGLTYFTPNINIFRDPRWGRGQETPGEDPYLTSHYAAVMVMSLQYGCEYFKRLQTSHVNEDAKSWKPRIAATCKHFATYSLETNRLNFSANIHDERDWDDTYLPAFDACINAGRFLHDYYKGTSTEETGLMYDGALGVMCSYNAIDGIPACADSKLLQGLLREKWNFAGYVVSDCWAISNIHENHHYASSYEQGVGMALKAGVDLDCGDTVQGYGIKAVDEGHMAESDVDHALTNLFGVLFDLGYFDNDQQTMTEDRNSVTKEETQRQNHDKLALEAALQSIVLLNNGQEDNATKQQSSRPLPLSLVKHARVTLVGPLADDKEALLGNYHGTPSTVITPLQGLQALGVNVEYMQGCNVTDDISDEYESDDALCKYIVSVESVDATVLVMGLNQSLEAEDNDRTTLLLPRVQHHVIEEAARCTKERSPSTPVILVLMSGGSVDVSSYRDNDHIDAILYTSYGGQSGGKALAHVIYGKYNPSGRLATTIYNNDYLGKVALEDMRMRPEESESNNYPGRTYRFFEGQVVYSFGHGLSYSNWDYTMNLEQNGSNEPANMIVEVSNAGPMDGSHSILLFHKGANAGKEGNPIKSLIAFEKVFVSAGEGKVVKFNIENWMSTQQGGVHTFMVGPTFDYSIQLKTSI